MYSSSGIPVTLPRPPKCSAGVETKLLPLPLTQIKKPPHKMRGGFQPQSNLVFTLFQRKDLHLA